MIALLLLARLAGAATYYVDPATGIDGLPHDGLSVGSAFATLDYTNRKVASGDVVIMEPGCYIGPLEFPNPVAVSVAGARITYVGDISNPSAVKLAAQPNCTDTYAVTINRSYISVKGAQLSSQLSFGFLLADSARADSFLYCTIGPQFEVQGAKYCAFDNIGGVKQFWISARQTKRTVGCSFQHINMASISRVGTFYGAIAGGWGWALGNVASNGTVQGSVDSCTFQFNRFSSSPATSNVIFEISATKHCSFRGNVWLKAGGAALRLEDSTYANTFKADTVRDTIAANTLPAVDFSDRYITAGCFGNEIDSSCMNSGGNALLFEKGMRNFTGTYNVLVTRNTNYQTCVKLLGGAYGRNFFDHNTLCGYVGLYDTGTRNWQDQTIVTNNIFYCFPTAIFSVPDCTPYNCDYPQGCGPNNASVWYVTAHIDSSFAAGGAHAAHLVSDHNLYSLYTYWAADTLGQQSLVFDVPTCGTYTSQPRAPGGTNRMWQVKYCVACDDSSFYGSPQFQDSLDLSTFSGLLRPGSKAIGNGSGGTDIGARANTNLPVIVVSPASMSFADDGTSSVQTDILTVSNAGPAMTTLHVTTITTTATEIGFSTTAFDLLPGASQNITVTFTPSGNTAARQKIITIVSDAPAHPSYIVPVYINQSSEHHRPGEID